MLKRPSPRFLSLFFLLLFVWMVSPMPSWAQERGERGRRGESENRRRSSDDDDDDDRRGRSRRGRDDDDDDDDRRRSRGRRGRDDDDDDDDRRRGRDRGRRGDDDDDDRRRRQERREVPGVMTQLRALDTNKNDKLDPNEVNRVSIAVYRRLGLDAGRSMSYSALNTIVGAADLEDLDLAELSEVSEIPGFDVIRSVGEDPGNFEPTRVDRLEDKRSLEERYSRDVINQIQRMFQQFDTNDDRMLDPGEQARVPWGSPDPEESDLDKNGKLTAIELGERLAARTVNGFVPANAEPEEEPQRREADERRRGREDRESEPDRSRARPTMSASDRTATYVKDLIAKYDTNQDGAMDAKEIESMRTKPKASADTDKDGRFTFEELYTLYSGGKKAKRSGVNATGELPGTVYWESILPENERSSSRSRRDRSDDDDDERPRRSGSRIPTVRYGIQ